VLIYFLSLGESEINQVTGDDVENEASHTYLTNEKSLTRPGSLRIKSVSKVKKHQCYLNHKQHLIDVNFCLLNLVACPNIEM